MLIGAEDVQIRAHEPAPRLSSCHRNSELGSGGRLAVAFGRSGPGALPIVANRLSPLCRSTNGCPELHEELLGGFPLRRVIGDREVGGRWVRVPGPPKQALRPRSAVRCEEYGAVEARLTRY